MRTRAAAPVLAALVLIGCDPTLPGKAQISVDRGDAGIVFGYLPPDTMAEQSLAIENVGLTDLAITGVVFAGSGEFTLSGPSPAGDAGTNLALVTGKKRTFLRVVFYPRAPKDYSGTITITSNADNAPKLVIPISGTGDAGL